MKKRLVLFLLSSILLVGCNNNNVIPATDLILSDASISINVGESKQITAEVIPTNSTDKKVTWSIVEGNDYATVDDNGLVNGIKAGTALLAATSNNITKNCSIVVKTPIHEILPTEITLNKQSVSLVVGESVTLNATVLPDNATDKSIAWAINEGSEAVSVSNGVVTALSVGTAKVQASTVNGLTATCVVEVKSNVILPTSISMNETSITLKENESKQLSATILPANATDKSVTWSVKTGQDIVSISVDGLVQAKKTGNAIIEAKTVNNLTASCTVSVISDAVLPTEITLNKQSVSLVVGESVTLNATVLPDNATDKSIAWTINEGSEAVSVSNGVVTALSVGTAKVQASTVNGLTAICNVEVKYRSLKGYINEDTHHLIAGNPYQKIGDADYVEILDKEEESGVAVYNFVFGATIKFYLKSNGYYEPTGLSINGVTHNIVDGAVTFIATVDDPDDPYLNFFDIEVKFKDNTPMVGDYEIVATNSTHIYLIFKYDVNDQETKACSQGDVINIIPVSIDVDYSVKTITGYSYITNDIARHKTYFDIINDGDGTYHFRTPFSSDDDRKIYIEVTEINNSLFKDSELVGEYAVVRTYGLSESSNYIDKFEEESTISFAASGEVAYKEQVAYASKAENGVINASYTTSNITMNFGKNILVIGESSSSQSMVSPLSQNSTDLAIGVKMVPGLLVKDIVLDNFVFKIGSDTYGVFSFYINDVLYASLYVDVTNKLIIPDVLIKQYLGSQLASVETVFEVFDKDNQSLIHIGYKNNGGKGNYCEINMRSNGYTNDSHTLIFINDETARYDEYICKVSGEENDIILDAPIRHIEITLNPDELTFVVTNEYEVKPKTLDIANKTFVGTSGSGNNLSVVFGPSNEQITGRVIEIDGCAFFWEFTAEFDATANELIIQVINVGYYYTYRPETTYPYIDSGALNGTRRIAVDDGKLTFIDNISGMTSYWITKSCVVTCDDFHF